MASRRTGCKRTKGLVAGLIFAVPALPSLTRAQAEEPPAALRPVPEDDRPKDAAPPAPAEGRGEGVLRKDAIRECRNRDPAKRIAALRTLAGASEKETLVFLIRMLQDPAAESRQAAAETLGASTDAEGVSVGPLCSVLVNEKEGPSARLAAARALSRAPYREQAIDAFIQTISGIDESERSLFEFGAGCTQILNALAGQDFGAGKDTPRRWRDWWKENRAQVRQEDARKRTDYLKAKRKEKEAQESRRKEMEAPAKGKGADGEKAPDPP